MKGREPIKRGHQEAYGPIVYDKNHPQGYYTGHSYHPAAHGSQQPSPNADHGNHGGGMNYYHEDGHK